MTNPNEYFSSKEIMVTDEEIVDLPVAEIEDQTYQLLPISKFNNEKDNSPQLEFANWAQFSEKFSFHIKKSAKSDNPCWSPTIYKAGEKRGNKNVVAISMAVLDVDSGVPFESLIKQIDSYAYLIHTSFSHTKEMPKYRVILPLANQVEANEWNEVWLRINTWLGNINDPATKDASRIYFMPACPPDSTDHFVKIANGKLLNISDLPELPVAVKKDLSQNNHWKAPIHIDGIEPIPADALGDNVQLVAMQQHCKFIQWVATPENQPIVSEPLWQAMLSNQCRFEGGTEAGHLASIHHPQYDEAATDRKIERCLNGSAPITCNRIMDLGFKGCPPGGCKLPSGNVTKSPAGLGVWANKKAESEDADQDASSDAIPVELKAYLNKYHSDGLIYVNGSFYGYKNGYWPRLNEQVDIRKKIALRLGKSAEVKKINELHSLCKDFCAADEQAVTPNLNLICLQNGTLDVEKGTLIDFSPDHHLTYKSDISWDENAKYERWLTFLNEIFVNDADKAEKIAFLKTWIGYCLVPDTTQHKFVWMVGGGGNGKGVLLAILTKLIGVSNVTDSHIEDLGDKYVRANLEGKLVNISSEMNANATLADGYLKSIVSGDRIAAERKYQDPFSFKPFVRLIGATNHLPRLQDLSEGFFRRAIILSFNRKFTDEDKDPELETRLTAELPGILTWAVEGLKELRLSGRFVIPPSSIEALQQYKIESDPVALFAGSCLQFNNDERMSPSEIYEGYKNWAKINGYSTFNIGNFGKRLAAIGPEYSRPGGNKKWHVKPINADGFEWDFSMMCRFRTPAPIQEKNANVIKLADIYKL